MSEKKEIRQNIKSWAQDDRPREKLLLKGKSSLSDAELVAILLGSGNREETAVDLAKRILASVDYNLHELGRLTIPALCAFKGIGEAKAISLLAALELGRRRRLSDALDKKKVFSSASCFELMQPIIGELPHEEFWVILLNASNRLLGYKRVSSGGLSNTPADPRTIFKEALLLNASAAILSHNHPSGNISPSEQDKKLTRKLVKAGEVLFISVLDHIIISGNRYYSFNDAGLM